MKEMVRHEYDNDDDDSNCYEYPLHNFAMEGDLFKLEEFIHNSNDKKCLERKIKPFDATPLRVSVAAGKLDCVRALIKYGANLEAVDIKGQTPVFIATSTKQPIILEELLKAGASPEGSPTNRTTPLLIAVLDGFLEGVKILLKYNANTEPTRPPINYGVSGWALQHCIVYQHFHIYLALIQAGASVSLTENLVSDELMTTRLSIPHNIMRYCPTNTHFLRLYYESGGKLLNAENFESLGNKKIEDFTYFSEQMKNLIGEPLTLRAVCRLKIRQTLGKNRLKEIPQLEIPSTLLSYLNYEEYEKFAMQTKINNHMKE